MSHSMLFTIIVSEGLSSECILKGRVEVVVVIGAPFRGTF
jgi:hypothetical protein